jgi:hypothetical protein
MLNKNPLPVASKYGTNIMKDNEVLLFVQTAIQNGSDTQEAIDDMKMIDSLLYSKRLHLKIHGHIKLTKNGYLRKGSDLYTLMESIIQGRTKLNENS